MKKLFLITLLSGFYFWACTPTSTNNTVYDMNHDDIRTMGLDSAKFTSAKNFIDTFNVSTRYKNKAKNFFLSATILGGLSANIDGFYFFFGKLHDSLTLSLYPATFKSSKLKPAPDKIWSSHKHYFSAHFFSDEAYLTYLRQTISDFEEAESKNLIQRQGYFIGINMLRRILQNDSRNIGWNLYLGDYGTKKSIGIVFVGAKNESPIKFSSYEQDAMIFAATYYDGKHILKMKNGIKAPVKPPISPMEATSGGASCVKPCPPACAKPAI